MNNSRLVEFVRSGRARLVVAALLLSALGVLGGCTTIDNLPARELEPFVPKVLSEPNAKKMVVVTWEVRNDVSEYCKTTVAQTPAIVHFFTPPVACARWDPGRNVCTIVTGPSTNHVVLGHEVRHCFEGRFH